MILHPEQWTLVSSWLPSHVPAVDNPHHTAWMAANPHAHAHREFLLTLAGSGWQGYQGAVYPRRPGSLFFFDAFESHDNFQPEWASDEDQLWVILLLQHILVKTWNIRNGRIEPRSQWGRVFTLEEIGVSPETLQLMTPDMPHLPSNLVHLQLISFLGLVLGAVAHHGFRAERCDDDKGLQHSIVDAIRQHLEATAGNGVTLDSLVQLTGYSKYHFVRLFKAQTGLTIHAYIDQCRMQRVRLLRANGQSQKAIAHDLGFSSPAAFAHWLRRCRDKHPEAAGVMPSALRSCRMAVTQPVDTED